MLKIAIIGCGQIADVHAWLIRQMAGAEIVAACDREELMARQLCERYEIDRHFTGIKDLLESAKPDVVHITTPPQSHFSIGKACLEHGCHVFMEKPFTVNAAEAGELVRIAAQKGLKVTVNHEQQFTVPAREMKRLIAGGYLGGPPVHVESYFGYDFGQTSYPKALLGDGNHWVRHLPGRLLHNVISHGIAKIAEHLASDEPIVLAHGFASTYMRNVREHDIIDELRVIVSDGQQFTAYFTFSSQLRPCLHHLKVYGPRNAIMVDHDQQVLIKMKGSRHRLFLENLIPPLVYSNQYFLNMVKNVRRFLKSDLHPKSGMKNLIRSFYESCRNDVPPPVPYRDIVLTVRIMDSIFSQVYGRESRETAGLQPDRGLPQQGRLKKIKNN